MPQEFPEPKTNDWIGLDVGGANIKIADVHGNCQSISFPMWTDCRKLSETLSQLLDEFARDGNPNIAATMTGELADCFASKQEGVKFICNALAIASKNRCSVYQVSGKFVSTEQAANNWKPTAASNWHALTNFVAEQTNCGIVFDIGSTTTDIIPFAGGVCATESVTDLDRLSAGELVYTGVVRSPVCSLVNQFECSEGKRSKGAKFQIAQELFATALDAYLVLAKTPESESVRFTADGRPATIECARQRLARCLCADVSELHASDIKNLASSVADAQFEIIADSFRRVYKRLENSTQQRPTIVISGEGSWLAYEIARKLAGDLPTIELCELIGKTHPTSSTDLNTSATAYAVACLAAKQQTSKMEFSNASR